MAEQVSIITTTYRAHDKIETCLNSVMEHTKYVDYKHHVMANDPDDRMKSVLYNSIYLGEDLFNDRIEPIYNDNNNGSFSFNNNDVAKEVEGKYILFLNDDCYPLNDDWLYNMVSIMEKDQKVGAVGSLLLYPGQKNIQHCGVFFSARTNNLPYHMFYKQPINKVAGYVLQPRYYQAVTAACMLVRRDDFLAVGGFCEDYWYMYEDIDLCLKLKTQLKKNCVYCPAATLIHNEGISGGKTNPKAGKNIEIFKEKWKGKYFNDLEMYESIPNHMIYKPRT